MHPVLTEILRARTPIQDHVLLRWQRAIRNEIGPALEEAEALKATSTPEPAPTGK